MAWTVSWVGVACVVVLSGAACSSSALTPSSDAAREAVATDSGGGSTDRASSPSAWSVHLALPDQAPTSLDALAGLDLQVSALDDPSGALDVSKHWPPSATANFNDAPLLGALHGCTADLLPHQITITSCAAYPLEPGCLTVTLQRSGAVMGSYVHPTGERCDIASASGDISLGALNADTGAPPRPDVATGHVVLSCKSARLDLRLEVTFGLRVARSFLAC